jgi:hypothetical protein
MPYVFNPDAAILYASPPGVEIDEAAFALQEEEFLLTHKCRRSASCQTERVMGLRANRGTGAAIDEHPVCLLRVDYDQQLEFQIDATALALQGLANHHPGAGLDDYALTFLNGAGDLPFLFQGGTWIYMEPSQDCAAGDLAEISFRVVREFTGLVEDGGEPPEPDFVSLPTQTPATLTADCLHELATAAFHNSHGFGAAGAAPLTLTLYQGNPLTTGTAISAPLTLTLWNHVAEPVAAVSTIMSNDAVLQFPADAADRILTDVMWRRNGITVAHKELAAPLLIPANFLLRVPVDALALTLTWPSAGELALSWTEQPARYALRFIFGAEDFHPSQTTIFIDPFDGDPHTGGVALGAGSFVPDMARDSSAWTVTGATVVSAAGLASVETAPAGGWSVSHVVAGVDGSMGWVIVKQFDPPLFFAEGVVFWLHAGTLDVTVS